MADWKSSVHTDEEVIMKSSSCCPPDSIGRIPPPEDYSPKGSIQRIGSVEVYVSKPAISTDRAILVLHDLFGPDSGRTKQICDCFAENGYIVVMPTLLKDVPMYMANENVGVINQLRAAWYLNKFRWSRVGPEILEYVLPFMRDELGVGSIGLAGFCWGAYPMIHLLSEQQSIIKCAIAFHPSLVIFKVVFDKSVTKYIKDINVPVGFLAAGSDPSDIKAGGIADKTLQAESPAYAHCFFEEYEDQKHGWVNRGDLNDNTTARDYKDAMKHAFYLFEENV